MKRKTAMVVVTPAVCLLALMVWGTAALGYQATFEPRLSVSEEYSDNIFLTRDDPKGDFMTTVTPGFTAQLLTRNSGAELTYDPGYVMYADFNENNTWRHDASLMGWTEFSRGTRLEISDRFIRTEDPLAGDEIEMLREQEATLREAPTVRIGRQPYITNTAAANFSYEFGRDSLFDMGYTHRLLDNDDPLVVDNQSHNAIAGLVYSPNVRFGIVPRVEYLRGMYADDIGDFNDWMGSLGLIYRFSRHLDGLLQYAHTYRTYDTMDDPDVMEADDFHVYDPSMGVRYQLSEALGMNGRVGYFLQDNEHRDSEGGYYFEADGTWDADRMRIGLEAGHGYDRAELASEDLGLTRYTRFRASGAYDVTQHVSVEVSAFYRKSEYLDTADGREDDFYGAGASLDYQVLEWMALSLQYRYNRVDSTVETNEYAENRGMIQVTFTPTRPWRVVR